MNVNVNVNVNMNMNMNMNVTFQNRHTKDYLTIATRRVEQLTLEEQEQEQGNVLSNKHWLLR
jgi:hypothetical protein